MVNSANEPLPDRFGVARKLITALLYDLETAVGTIPVIELLNRAKRVAKLLRDSDIEAWLDLEVRGYPENLDVAGLGSAAAYVVQSGRIKDGEIRRTASLLSLEASSGRVREPVFRWLPRPEYAEVLSALHSYVSDIHIALTFGVVAENIFSGARAIVDTFVAKFCLPAAEQLSVIHERLAGGSDEELSQALTSCRRLLSAVADAVFPPSTSPYRDGAGRERKVGPDEYKNRLLAVLETGSASASDTALVVAEAEHLAGWLDAVESKASKGVHAHVGQDEANLCAIHTYLIVAEVARSFERLRHRPIKPTAS